VCKLADAAVCAAVEQRLTIGWTPVLIAREVPEAGSPRTIYRAIRGPQAVRWGPMLPGMPKCERLRKQKRERIHGRVMIDDRPAIVATRERIGDWEGDTIRPVAGSDVGLLTLVERKTRVVRMALLPDRSAATLNATAARLLAGFVVHTLTVDNGMEFASHKELSALIGAPVYFAHEHSPWERGANEQINKLIRYFMPRGIDMAGYSAADASLVEALLNERPRKCLAYLSPEQSMQASLHLNWQSASLQMTGVESSNPL
jgi:IS30 family transposase